MPGTWIEKLGVWSDSVNPPIWKSENAQWEHVSHCASLAAIFIGCSSATRIRKWLPNQRFTHETGTSTISAIFAAGMNVSTLRPRRKCQQQTAKTTADPAVNPANIVCPNAHSAQLLERSAQTLVSCA